MVLSLAWIVVQCVFGLADRLVAKPHFRYRDKNGSGTSAAYAAYSPLEVASIFELLKDVNGTEPVIGLIKLGGCYRPADIREDLQASGLQSLQI